MIDAMRFNICIVAPKDYAHSMAFLELAELVQYSLLELGFDAKLTFNEMDIACRNILIGCHLLEPKLISDLPPSTVILNTEQIYADDTWDSRIFEFARHFEVWDYSRKNIEKFTQLGLMRVKHLKIGFQKELARIQNLAEPEIDVLFYGAVGERRAQILKALIERGLKVKVLYDTYGRERDEWIANSKVVLNLHHYQSQIFEIVRVFYLMSNAKAVVCEVNANTSVDAMYLNGVAAVPYEELVERCVELVRNPERRKQVEQAALRTIAQYPQAQWTQAVLSEEASAADAVDVQAWYQAGFEYQQATQLDLALTAYQKVLHHQPDHFNAANMLATVLVQLGRNAEAVRAFDRVLSLDASYAITYHNRAVALENLGRQDEALAGYSRAIELDPNYVSAYLSRGNLRLTLHRLPEALEDFERALELSPTHVELYDRRGVVLSRLKQHKKAIDSYTQAIALDSGVVSAYNNRAIAWSDLEQWDRAIADYTQAIALQPTMASPYNNRGNLYRVLKRYPEAIADFDQTLRLQADYPSALIMAAHSRALAADWAQLPLLIERLKTQLLETDVVSVPFPVLALLDEPEALRQCAHTYTLNKHPLNNNALCAPTDRVQRHDGRIRIAYLSADLYNHATAFLMAELFERHDRTRFDVFAYSFGPDRHDAMRERVERAFEHFYDVATWSDEQIARHMRAQGIAIAIDLKGYTGDSRTNILAWKPAPIAVNYIGYPGTMGAEYIDYIIADHTLIPPEYESCYTEQVVRLPDSYQPNDRQRRVAEYTPTRTELGLPENGFVFCCFNNNYKILPPMFDIWMRLLLQTPNSVLWLLKDNDEAEKNLRKEAEQRGVAPERLIFAGRAQLPEHLARHKQADLFLDTLPYNAHTTTSDALWVGLPVLTCMGKSFAARVAASLLRAVGMPELVTHSLAEYERLALELTRNPERLQAIHNSLIANRDTCALFDTERYVRYLEQAYERMFARAEQGLPPEMIDVSVDAAADRG